MTFYSNISIKADIIGAKKFIEMSAYFVKIYEN